MTFDLTSSGIARDDAAFFLDVIKKEGFAGQIDHRAVLAIRPDMTLWQAHDVLERMSANGFIRPDEDGEMTYTLTAEGRSLLRSGLKPRVSAKAIEKDLAKLIANARAFNADREHPVVVSSIKVFGSALFDRADYGGLDVEISYGWRKLTPAQRKLRYEALPRREKGECYDTRGTEVIVAQHAERLARRPLCKGTKCTSIAAQNTIRHIAPDWKEVFAYSVEEEKELAPEGVVHPRDEEKQRKVFGGKTVHTKRPIQYRKTRKAMPANNGFIQNKLPGSSALEFGCLLSLGKGMLEDVLDPTSVESILSRHAAIVGSEDAPAWQRDHKDAFAALRAAWQKGVYAKFLADAPIELIFKPRRVECLLTLRGQNEKSGKPMRMRFAVIEGSKQRELEFPRWEAEENRFEPLPFYLPIELTIARTMCMPLFEMLETAKIPGGVGVFLSVFWHPSEPAPVIPNLGPLCRRAIERAKSLQVSKPTFDAAVRLAMGEGYPDYRMVEVKSWMMVTAQGRRGADLPDVQVKCAREVRTDAHLVENIGVPDRDLEDYILPATDLVHSWHAGLRQWTLMLLAEREDGVWLGAVDGLGDAAGLNIAVANSKVSIVRPQGADVIDFGTASQRRRELAEA